MNKNMKIGQRVQIQSDEYGGHYKGRYGVVVEEDRAPLVAIDGGDVVYSFYEQDLQEVPVTIESLCKGDVVVYINGDEIEVVHVSDQLVVTNQPFSYTKLDLIDDGYTVKTQADTPEYAYDKDGNKIGEIENGKIIN